MRPFHILFTVPSGNSAVARVTIGEGNAIGVLIQWHNKPSDQDRKDGGESVQRGLEALGLEVAIGESHIFPTRAEAEIKQSGYLAKSAMQVNRN